MLSAGKQALRSAALLMFFAAAASLTAGKAIAVEYTFMWPTPFPAWDYISASTGETPVDLEGNTVSQGIPLGFTFDYFGSPYSEIFVDSSGKAGFLSDGTAVDAVMRPLSSELDLASGGNVYTLAGGVAGERYFVIEWVGVPVKNKGGSRSFEIVLYEDNSDILFQYSTLRGGESIDAAATNVGVESAGGTMGLFLDPVRLGQIGEGKSMLFSENQGSADNDSDGMPDRYEAFHNVDDPLSDEETVPDGLNNLDEFQGGTKPRQEDTDGDGLLDGPDPYPLETDGDRDGIRDGDEETDPDLPDTDADGYNDAVEITFGSDPNEAALVPNTLSQHYKKVTGTIQGLLSAVGTVDGDILYIPAGEYPEAVTIDKPVTLVGAGPEQTILRGSVTISGVSNVTVTGLTIKDGNPAVTITDHASPTAASLVNVVLENCTNGVLISGGTGSAAVEVKLDQLKYTLTEPMTSGYGIKVENLVHGGDQVDISNAAVSLAAGMGAVILDNAQNISITGASVSGTYGPGIRVSGAQNSNILVDNSAVLSNSGDGVQVDGDGTGIVLNRNDIADNGQNGVNITGTVEVTVTDNNITQNGVYGLAAGTNATVSNSGNAVEGNLQGNYSVEGSLDRNEVPAAEVGTTSADKLYGEAAMWVKSDKGGTAAVLDPLGGLQAGTSGSIFGSSVTMESGALTEDTGVVIAGSTGVLPALPDIFTSPFFTTPVRISLDNTNAQFTANSAAGIALPVTAGFTSDAARVFRLIDNNSWEEISAVTPEKHPVGWTEPTLPQRVAFESTLGTETTFVVVVDLPVVRLADTGVGSGCRIAGQSTEPEGYSVLFDTALLILAPFYLILRRRRPVRDV
jgi:hypothetical protein